MWWSSYDSNCYRFKHCSKAICYNKFGALGGEKVQVIVKPEVILPQLSMIPMPYDAQLYRGFAGNRAVTMRYDSWANVFTINQHLIL